MPGVYIHVPFCKQACSYCNFHFSTSLKWKKPLVDALCKEIEMRAGFFKTKDITSIYFGGGTPSLLDEDDLVKIFKTLSNHFLWKDNTEITLEANPDDINREKCSVWSGFGINRLSIGIQSFHENELIFMNRAHNTTQALQCIDIAQDSGYSNLTCDLIYGIPGSTLEGWEKNIQILLQKNIPHISAYALTVENKTLYFKQIQKNIFPPPDDRAVEEQFNVLMAQLSASGYLHYEISNFAMPDSLAKHNTNYWLGDKYLGIGPSAHSYTGDKRMWNINNNVIYIKNIQENNLCFESENLTPENKYNEYIMTGLRTMWGVETAKIGNLGISFLDYFLNHIQPYITSGQVIKKNNVYRLSQQGKLFADRIASELFLV